MKDRSSKKAKHVPSQKCTACDKDLRSCGIDDMRIHSLLKVLVCVKCYENYGDGDFTKYDDGVDEEGDDNYCRWCADGGDLLVCCGTNCHYAYCKKCIKRNLGRKIYQSISDSEDWHCFACDKDQLSDFVDFAEELMEKSRRISLKKSEEKAKKEEKKKEEEKKKDDEKKEEKEKVKDKENVEKSPEPLKTNILITPTTEKSFTPSARKREARAKKSTAKPARIFEENGEDDSDTKDSDTKTLSKAEVDEKIDAEEEKAEQNGKKKNTEQNDVSMKDSGEEDNDSFFTVKADVSEKVKSPRRSGRILHDVTIEEKDGDDDEVKKTPQRKLHEDVVIEDDDTEKDKEPIKSSKTMDGDGDDTEKEKSKNTSGKIVDVSDDEENTLQENIDVDNDDKEKGKGDITPRSSCDKRLTSTPIANANSAKKILSTTIEQASDESGNDSESDKNKTPQKRKSERSAVNSEPKKRRTTRSSVASEELNGKTESSNVNFQVNTIIQETNELTTEYIRLMGLLRDAEELDTDIVAKLDELTGKLHLKLHFNSVSIHNLRYD